MQQLFRQALSCILVACAAGAFAQGTSAGKPIRLLVGSPPGGGNDVVARIVAQHMNVGGASVVVENRPGAASMISADLVAKSPPDGTTLLLVSQSVIAVSPILNKITSFDPMKDFAGVALLGNAPLVLVAGPALPAKTVPEVIAFAKANPGVVNFGSGGIGTSPHMAGSLFGLMTGTRLTSVPFQGEQPSMTEIIGGRVHMMFGNAAAAMPHVKAGRLRGIAVTSARRQAFAPELPTVAEAGVADFEIGTWLGVVAPAATPKAMVAQLHGEILRVLDLPQVKDRLVSQGFAITQDTPEQFSQYMRAEYAKWGKVIKDANIKAE